MSTREFAVLFAFLWAILLPTAVNGQVNQALDGQLTGLAQDVLDFLDGDRLLKGQMLRMDRVSSSGMPDANYGQFVQQNLAKRLSRVVGDSARLRLKIELSYMVSETGTNRDNRVIQIVAKVLERGRTKKSIIREVNNTSDIARILGVTYSPPETNDYEERLAATEAAFETPSFKTVQGTQIASPGSEKYSVEIRKRDGGSGEAKAVTPKSVRGLAFAPVDISDTCEIVLYNYDTQADVVAKVDIDGLDVLNGFSVDLDDTGESVRRDGYLIPHATASQPGNIVLSGWWRTSDIGKKTVFPFSTNEYGKGSADEITAHGRTCVITARFFSVFKEHQLPSRWRRKVARLANGDESKRVLSNEEPISLVTIRSSRFNSNSE